MFLHLDFSSKIPIYQQIRDQIVLGISEGKLHAGEQLPTVRALAEESGINVMTASKAYQVLKQDGYIITDRKRGTVVKHMEGKKAPPEAVIDSLKLSISELRLAGLSGEEVLSLCRKMYEEG